MRAFIAIELSQEIKSALAGFQESLRSSGAEVKWVEPQNIHLTLKFLGEIDAEQLGRVILIIEEIARDKAAFSLSLSSLGAFPNTDFPRVIWAGIRAGSRESVEIAEDLEIKLEKIGMLRQNLPFSSHITIGRTKSSLNRKKLAENLKIQGDNLGRKNLECPVTKIALFKSTLSPKGPTYEILKEVILKTN